MTLTKKQLGVYIDDSILNDLISVNGIIFDCDVFLIDITKSYDLTIDKTVKYVLENFSQITDNIKIDFVFHLAAQSLVLRGYKDTLNTWNTNVMGTANLLEALRQSNHACVVIAITTDKVYRNNETSYAFRENDHLGGIDP